MSGTGHICTRPVRRRVATLSVLRTAGLSGLHLDAEGVVFPGGVEQQEVGDSGYHSLVFELLPGDAVPASAVGDCEKQPPPCVVLEAEPAHAAALQPMFFVPGRAARLFLLLFLQVLFVGQ